MSTPTPPPPPRAPPWREAPGGLPTTAWGLQLHRKRESHLNDSSFFKIRIGEELVNDATRCSEGEAGQRSRPSRPALKPGDGGAVHTVEWLR